MITLLTSLALLASAAPVATSTASEWQRSGAHWERLAEETLGELDESRARVTVERAGRIAAETNLELTVASSAAANVALRIELTEVRIELASRVSPASRTFSVGAAVAATLGFGAAILGPVLCRSPTDKLATGLGGAAVGSIGSSILWWSW